MTKIGMPGRKAILVAEDSEEDAYILKRAFQEIGCDVPLLFVRDGQEAMDYLSGEGEFDDRKTYPLPRLMLLDLKMPKMDGFDVLGWLQNHPKLKTLPVAVLTSSNHDKDVDRAYGLGANSYLVKPTSFDDFVGIVEKLRAYWIEINRPPSAVL
jgi:CheY-like chemotaxis protein